jgi:hypothetical protein
MVEENDKNSTGHITHVSFKFVFIEIFASALNFEI